MSVFRPTHMSPKGIEFLIAFESIKLEAYHIKGEKFWTIGAGHNGPDVHKGMKITRAEAIRLLRRDLARFEKAVLKLVPWRWRRTQARFDALVSLAFNLGEEILTADPPLQDVGRALKLRPVTQPNKARVAAAIKEFTHGATGEMAGLVRRRNAEARLFTTGNYSTA